MTIYKCFECLLDFDMKYKYGAHNKKRNKKKSLYVYIAKKNKISPVVDETFTKSMFE